MLQETLQLSRSLCSLGLLCLATTSTVIAQPLIEEQQRLDFGTLAIAANTSVSRFTYFSNGVNINIEGQFVLIARGSPGRYRFTGFPANTPLSISVTNTTLAAGATGIPELLNVDNYDFADPVTDAQGTAELSLGARLNTTGSGDSYVDAPYTGTALLRVEYWQPDVQRFVANTKTIDVDTQLNSTLTIDEDQQLHFGTLFARSSNVEQAVLTIAPSGTYTISEPGNSRFVVLASPEQGVLNVSGAAPNYILTITPQTTEVLLEHTESPVSAPHFILSDLVTSPDGTGVADVNGELLIQVGGTLKTELTASPAIYPSGQYEGTYQLVVSY